MCRRNITPDQEVSATISVLEIDLRDQSRTAAPERGSKNHDERFSSFPSLSRQIDPELGGVLLANMLEAWLDADPSW